MVAQPVIATTDTTAKLVAYVGRIIDLIARAPGKIFASSRARVASLFRPSLKDTTSRSCNIALLLLSEARARWAISSPIGTTSGAVTIELYTQGDREESL
jgi:hypothetical protein